MGFEKAAHEDKRKIIYILEHKRKTNQEKTRIKIKHFNDVSIIKK